jgi:hypothetical protein
LGAECDGAIRVKGLAGENLNKGIVRGLLRGKPDLDIVRVQDAGLSGLDAPSLLAWGGRGRVLITHDVSTMTARSGHTEYGHSTSGSGSIWALVGPAILPAAGFQPALAA